jgi:hypothetical protein
LETLPLTGIAFHHGCQVEIHVRDWLVIPILHLTTPGMSVVPAVHETSGLLAYCEMLHVEEVTGQWE